MNQIERILLRRRHMITMAEGKETECGAEKAAYIGAMLKNIQSLGFTFENDVLQRLRTLSVDEIVAFYKDIEPELKELVGADKEYAPMYPNFPEQVMEMDDAELFLNAIVHCLSDGTLVPEYKTLARFPLIGEYKFTGIRLGTTEDAMEIFTNLLASKTSLSAQDKEDVACFVKETNFKHYLPKEIPLKESRALFGKLLMDEKADIDASYLRRYFETVTDVLRLVVAMSDGDISMSSGSRIRIRKLTRKERRFIMDLLAGCGDPTEDMFRYRGLWITIGEVVHPGEFSKNKKYEKVIRAFEKVRGNDKPLFWSGRLEDALHKKDVGAAVSLLKERPGEFARRLNQLLSISDTVSIPAEFSLVADRIATPVLWQVREFFLHRYEEESGPRVFFPKGNAAKVFAADNNMPAISEPTCKAIVDICDAALINQYKEREPLGKVFVDSDMNHYVMPFSQRSANSAFKALTRGSRLPIEDGKPILRSFIWWTNTKDGARIDIDLSAVIYDEKWTPKGHVSYTNLKSETFGCVHSGDIVNGGPYGKKGVAEFIDVNIDDAEKSGARYIVMQVYCFTNIPFNQLPCSFGWMQRSRADQKKGRKFDPRTVEQNIAITTPAHSAMPVIIDCKEKTIIWADAAMSASSGVYGGNNVESNIVGSTATAYAIAGMHKTSIMDVVITNAMARGTVVPTREEADIIFSNDTTKPIVREFTGLDENGIPVYEEKEKDVPIITAYDLDYYMGSML